MHLRDILKEDASEEAKRMGLEYYGFGRYGKDGRITHVSQNGSLIAYKAPAGDAPTSKQPPEEKTKYTPVPDEELPADDPRREFRRLGRRVYKTNNASSSAKALRESLGSNNEITDINKTLSALTKTYGRETAPEMDERDLAEFKDSGYSEPLAIYDPSTDKISLSKRHSTRTPIGKNISEWSFGEVEAFKLMVHETLHSTSTRLREETFYTNGINIGLEEGLTEYLAQSTTFNMFGKDNQELNKSPEYLGVTYTNFVDAIDLMATHGNFDVDSSFKESNIDTFRGNAWNSQYYVIMSAITQSGITDDEFSRNVLNTITADWGEKDTLSMFNPEVSGALRRIYKDIEDKKSNPETAKELLSKALGI